MSEGSSANINDGELANVDVFDNAEGMSLCRIVRVPVYIKMVHALASRPEG